MSLQVNDHAGANVPKGFVILGLVIFYAALYLRGLDFGDPICEHGDEWAITEQAMEMVAHGPFHPLREYTYGSLCIFVQCGISSLLHAYNNAFGIYRDAENHPIKKDISAIAKNPVDRDLFRFHLAGRVSVACYAGILFWLLYRLGMELFGNRPSAYLCVIAAMVNPLLLQQAHFILPNVLATLLAVATVYCSAAFLNSGNKRTLYFGAILAGLAVGAKVTMVWAFPAVALAALLRWRAESIKHAPFLLAAFVGAFLVAEPYILFDTRNFYVNFAREARTYSLGTIMDSRDFQSAAFGSEAMRSLAARWRLLYPIFHWFCQGHAYFIVGLAGIIALPFLTGRKSLVVLVFPLLVFLFIGMQRKVLTTNYVPLIPFYALGIGAAFYGLLRWRYRLNQPFKTFISIGILVLLLIALDAPAKTSRGIIRQFTTRDPYQTALNWIESNAPKDAKIAAERGMLAAFPFTNEGFSVKTGFFFFYSEPYTRFLDLDYVVALSPGLCDRFPFLYSMFLSREKNPVEFESYLKTRRINEQRLTLERHVTPEECGYVPYAETPIVAHDVYVYKVPKVTPVRILPTEPAENDKPSWHVSVEQPLQQHVQLPAGRYDVFLDATRKIGDVGIPAAVDVRAGERPGCRVYLFDTGRSDHFVSTIELAAPEEVAFQIALRPPTQPTIQNVWVYGIICVPTTGNVIGGIPIQIATEPPANS